MNSLLEIRDLTVGFGKETFFGRKKTKLLAVENVSLSLLDGETLGLVGESGCGKSTLGRAILKLLKPSGGGISYKGKDILSLSDKEFLPFRKKIQIVFQDPYSSLNPRMNIKEILTEGLLLHEKRSDESVEESSRAILENVGLPTDILYRYPHEFSGGQRQRIAIARALVLKPEFIVLDEAVSALDVSTQAQVLLLLQELKRDFGLSYLFISHDLGIVRAISDRIAVMYLGRIVETGPTDKVFDIPSHPYTKALFGSIFDIENRKTKKIPLKGEVPSILNKPKGCHFHTRCPIAQPVCGEQTPEWKTITQDHKALCHFPLEK
ncbi:oligopeptide ABC transporter, ATP-binding protein AppF [Leptospira inadai serovar Lyme str. 10]|uniref:Oligopeptide ABC transporter, ATP-binding protein AppF n=2 Tax=Leptospira inadai serovar Lyme TaxID=293084 RepID=V6H8D1_9LEPT|nr:ABC transporter ATP-binding protein [Leptospira inadai]EQA35151.1 oligopeptide ABC transporter, ATP-binding protein AppF [Leptospira inadai serovar Lyme str. 10]PNV76035.1 dipeptide/oligopeptide/nickel ABC transporter ATP-binding protein [Leptospira inadai serovar Lyme]